MHYGKVLFVIFFWNIYNISRTIQYFFASIYKLLKFERFANIPDVKSILPIIAAMHLVFSQSVD